MNTVARLSIVGGVVGIAVLGGLGMGFYQSPLVTLVKIAKQQPIPFSHKHHVSAMGIDCRYCHTTVEETAFAGIPPTETCMTCHSQVWTRAGMLEPVRTSWETGVPLKWKRVNDLPDFVYFDHSIHVNKGVGCVTCHGRVDQMPLTWKGETLHMKWCLECHRAPEKFIRPKDKIFEMAWKPADDGLQQATLGPRLVDEYGIKTGQLTNCSICHR